MYFCHVTNYVETRVCLDLNLQDRDGETSTHRSPVESESKK